MQQEPGRADDVSTNSENTQLWLPQVHSRSDWKSFSCTLSHPDPEHTDVVTC